jgi:hypothetical protein
MRLWRARAQPKPPTVYVGDYTHKLSRIRPLAHDEDERQTREDRDYARSLFSEPAVGLPRFLSGDPKRRG